MIFTDCEHVDNHPYQPTVKGPETRARLVSSEPFGTVAAHEHTVSDETARRLSDAIPPNTRRAYARIWDGRPRPNAPPPPDPQQRGFVGWCEINNRTPLPSTPETLAEYTRHLCDRNLSPPTIEQAVAAIRTVHRWAGYGRHFPDVDKAKLLIRQYRRDRAGRPGTRTRQATPVLVDALNKMIATIDPATALGARDHALLLLGLVTLGRRCEIAAFTWDDLRDTEEGLSVYVAMSKTDQAARGETVPVSYGALPGTDPVAVLARWRSVLATRGIADGPLLRRVSKHDRIGGAISARIVNDVVQRRARLATLPRGYSAHSLRAGGATIAYKNGATIETICRLGRWKLGSTAVLGYIREVDQWKDHPFRGVL